MQVSAFAVIKIFKRRKNRVLAFIQCVFVKKKAGKGRFQLLLHIFLFKKF